MMYEHRAINRTLFLCRMHAPPERRRRMEEGAEENLASAQPVFEFHSVSAPLHAKDGVPREETELLGRAA